MATQVIQATNENPAGVQPSSLGDLEFRAAYARRLAEIQAVPDETFAGLNLDVHDTVTTVLGALPEINAFGEQIAKLPGVNVALIEGLGDYVMAASEAQSLYVTATSERQDLAELDAAARKGREVMRSDAMALVNRGIIPRARVAAFEGNVGFKNVAFELMDWANLMDDVWPLIEGKTALTRQEIHDAKALGERMVRAIGLREQAPAVQAATARIRRQALTLLVTSYDEVRRALSFLRWKEGDVETIAPSLYTGRGRKPGHGKEPVKDETPAAPAAGIGGERPAANPNLPGGSPFAED